MRAAMWMAAIGLGAAAPAQAQIAATVQTNTGRLEITGGYIDYCPDIHDQQSCVRSAPTIDSPFPDPNFAISGLDGTYTFSGFFGANSNAGTFSYAGSATFLNGALLSDYYDFSYARAQVFAQAARTTYATGRVSNAALTIHYGMDLPTRTLMPIPEPATWTSMLVGFAAVGGILRRRRRHADRTGGSRSAVRV